MERDHPHSTHSTQNLNIDKFLLVKFEFSHSLQVEKDCQRGYICLRGSDIPNPTDGVKGRICPAGSFCLAGDATDTRCPVNSYQPSEGTCFVDCSLLC